tara:strand:+ start:13063 stop:13887 length:825 start_codon:yes stop_codon:yes gene_type:complete
MTINTNGKIINLSSPKIMGILNITPDSFYDGGKFNKRGGILKQIEKMVNSGVDIIDVGGYSSRPGAKDVSIENELNRVIPAIELIKKKYPNAIISIDTFRGKVANEAIETGAAIVNDISGGNLDSSMFEVVAKYKTPYVLMHMKGTPANMMSKTNYSDVTKDVCKYFSERIAKAKSFGINDIMIDPGFGFSKTIKQNYELLNNLEFLKQFDKPLVVGVSRKSMIYKTLNTTPEKALNGSSVLHAISLIKGANILRTHDVKEAAECIKIVNELNG